MNFKKYYILCWFILLLTLVSSLNIKHLQVANDDEQPWESFSNQIYNDSNAIKMGFQDYELKNSREYQLGNNYMNTFDVLTQNTKDEEAVTSSKNELILIDTNTSALNSRTKRSNQTKLESNITHDLCEKLQKIKNISDQTIKYLFYFNITGDETETNILQPFQDTLVPAISDIVSTKLNQSSCGILDICNLFEPIVLDLSRIYYNAYRKRAIIINPLLNGTDVIKKAHAQNLENSTLVSLKHFSKWIHDCKLSSKNKTLYESDTQISVLDLMINLTNKCSDNQNPSQCNFINEYRSLFSKLDSDLSDIISSKSYRTQVQRNKVDKLYYLVMKVISDESNIYNKAFIKHNCGVCSACYKLEYLVFEITQLYFNDKERLAFKGRVKSQERKGNVLKAYDKIKVSASRSLWSILSKMEKCEQSLNSDIFQAVNMLEYQKGFLEENYGKTIVNEDSKIFGWCFLGSLLLFMLIVAIKNAR